MTIQTFLSLPLGLCIGLLPTVTLAEAAPPQTPLLIAQAQLYGIVIPNELNVRVGAGINTPVLYVLHRDVVVRITGQYGDGADNWYRELFP